LSDKDELKPIVPPMQPQPMASNQDGSPVVQLYSVSTISARPTFFVYIPQTSAQNAEFTLSDEMGKDVVEATFALPRTPGVVGLTLPSNTSSLEVGKTYKWSVQILCPARDMDGDNGANPTINGEVERIQPPDTLVNIGKVAPSDRPDLYAKSQIWYDSISSLAELQYANPQDLTLKQDWVSLLKSVNLDTVAEAPLLPEVTLLH
jgi:hypothetical protein